MTNDILDVTADEEWYAALVEDCAAIITETIFTVRWAKVSGFHALGERIVNDGNFSMNARGNGATLNDLSKSVGIHERDIYRAIQFYNKYPVLDTVPEGKNISWNKIVTKYLPETPEPPVNWAHKEWCNVNKECNCHIGDT